MYTYIQICIHVDMCIQAMTIMQDDSEIEVVRIKNRMTEKYIASTSGGYRGLRTAHCNTLQHTTTHCDSTLCNTLPHTATQLHTDTSTSSCYRGSQTVRSNTRKHAETHGNTL